MPKIAVMTDSSADINTQQAEQMNLAVMRFPLMIDGQEYIEETEIKTPGSSAGWNKELLLRPLKPI